MIRILLYTAFYIFSTVFLNAQTVTIAIDAASGSKPVSPYIYGRNNSLSDNSSKPLSASQWQLLRDAGVTFFRECGGNNSTKYNWRRKLSSHPDWYNNVYGHNWDFAAKSLQQNISSAQGNWSFQLIGKVAKSTSVNFNDWGYNGSQWWSGVNQNLAGGGIVNPAGGNKALKDGDPSLYTEDWPADSTVKILDNWYGSKGIGIDSTKTRYWGMDNEPEIWNGTHDDVMPVQIDAEVFMQRYFEVAKKARAKFPGIKLCGPVPANEWQWYNWKNDAITYNGKKYVWLEYFILRIGEEQKATGIKLLDVLDIHFYPGETKTEDVVQLHRVYFDPNYVYPGANGVHRIGGGWNTSINKEYILLRCKTWLEQYIGKDHGVSFAVSETGINDNIKDANIVANWYASTLGEFAKQGVDFFTPWSWKNGMYEVLHLFSRYGQENYIAATSTDENYVSAYPMINTNSDSMTIFLINRHVSETKSILVDIKNFIIRNEAITMYTLSKLPANETFVSHTVNALKSKTIEKPVYNVAVQLEPMSVNAIVLRAATSSAEIKPAGTGLNLYPNPSIGKVNIEFSSDRNCKVDIDIFNSSGERIKSILKYNSFVGKNNIETDLTGNVSGLYWISLKTDKTVEKRKFIIENQ